MGLMKIVRDGEKTDLLLSIDEVKFISYKSSKLYVKPTSMDIGVSWFPTLQNALKHGYRFINTYNIYVDEFAYQPGLNTVIMLGDYHKKALDKFISQNLRENNNNLKIMIYHYFGTGKKEGDFLGFEYKKYKSVTTTDVFRHHTSPLTKQILTDSLKTKFGELFTEESLVTIVSFEIN